MRLGQGPSIFILIPTDISIPFTIQVYDYSFMNYFLEVGRGGGRIGELPHSDKYKIAK